MTRPIATFLLLASVLLMVACSHRDNVSYKDDVKKALEQAELKDVTVSEDQDKNTITLGGRCIPTTRRPRLQT
jgi:ABC-type enterochelin transport system substrate-binding protein